MKSFNSRPADESDEAAIARNGRVIRWAMIVGGVLVAIAVGLRIPIGTTEAGNPILVQDYVSAVAPQPPARTTPTKRYAEMDAQTFDLITPGGTPYNDLMIRAFGPGELMSATNVGGYPTEMRRWTNHDGSRIVLTIQNGVIVAKAQAGLQ